MKKTKLALLVAVPWLAVTPLLAAADASHLPEAADAAIDRIVREGAELSRGDCLPAMAGTDHEAHVTLRRETAEQAIDRIVSESAASSAGDCLPGMVATDDTIVLVVAQH
jgi:hypothetical protein